MPSRRTRSTPPMSFFAFQDVMIAMIGVVLVVTLILLLNVGQSAAQALAGLAEQTSAPSAVSPEYRLLKARLERLRAMPSADDSREAIAELDARLQSVDTALRAERARIEADRAHARRMVIESTLAGDQAVAQRLLEEQERLEEEIDTVRRSRRLVYLIAEDNSRPVVAELMDGRCVLSTDQVRDAPLAISETDPRRLAQHVLDWFAMQEGRRHLLVVLKPSGLEAWAALQQALGRPEYDGLDIGIDLISEHMGTTDQFTSEPAP